MVGNPEYLSWLGIILGSVQLLLPDRCKGTRETMMLVAGRMTATARADIGARDVQPTVKVGPRFAYRRVMTLVRSDDDLIGSLSLIRALGIDRQIGGADVKRSKKRCENCRSLNPACDVQPVSANAFKSR